MIACGEDEGAKIDVSRLEPRTAHGGVARQRDRLLRDVAPRARPYGALGPVPADRDASLLGFDDPPPQ